LTKDVFSDSAILTTDAQRKFVISLFVGEVFNAKIVRLYKASSNGFGASAFHSLCDNKGPTLTLIKTVAGHTFGGFTTISWDSTTAYKNDTQSFLFSVEKQTKYPIVNNYGNAIYCHSSYGPTFGGGHTIHVADNSNSNTSSYVQKDYNYNMPAGANGNHSILTDGNTTFQTTEVEVYLVQ
jgi:hypothetical protein